MIRPTRASDEYALADGVVALPGGLAFLTHAGALVCADAHLGYEDAIGGGAALPLWSTTEIVATITLAARRHDAREIIFLGDAIHAASLSEGAARTIRAALDALRANAAVTIVAGNHEGRTRGAAILGETVEACERDGWMLVHGDKPTSGAARTMIGHLHPSLRLAGDRTAPVFLATPSFVVVPALTPYSPGLDVFGQTCAEALSPWAVTGSDMQVVATTDDRVYPLGTLAVLRRAVDARYAPHRRRNSLRPDRGG